MEKDKKVCEDKKGTRKSREWFCIINRQRNSRDLIDCFHSRVQHLWKLIETKESVCIRKEFNSQRTGLQHKHGRRFIILEHQYGHRDVMWKRYFGESLFTFFCLISIDLSLSDEANKIKSLNIERA